MRISRVNALGQLKDVWEITAADSSTESTSFPNQSLSAGYRTSYTYDGLGNLTEVSQGAQTRTFTYDSLSRLLSAVNPESGTITYTYDTNSSLKTRRDARNIKTVYDYDSLNRLTKRCYRSIGTGSLGMTTCADNSETQEPRTSDVTYTYENSGITSLKNVLTKIENGISKTENVAFDATGRVNRTKQTTDGVVYGDDTNPMTYTYSLSGALVEQRYPSGRVVKNVLDKDGRLAILQSKKDSNSGYWNYASSLTYNAADAMTSMQLGNGRWESTIFNLRLQPTQIALGTTGPSVDGQGQTVYSTNLLDLDLDYSYGTTANNGNVLTQTITVPTVGTDTGFTALQTYSYDSLNRLKDATENITPHGGSASQSWKETFTFDRYGNRNFDEANTTFAGFDKLCNGNTELCADLRKKLNPAIDPSNNRIDTADDYGFDDAGNTTGDPDDREFVYDAENKQVKVLDDQDATIGEYFYDGDGRRVKKFVPRPDPELDEVTIFVYDAGGKLIEEYSTIVASTNDAKVAYLTGDHLGSPRINTDANGAVTARHDYHPFGEEIATSQRTVGLAYVEDTIRKQFTGYEHDSETELDFAKARMYFSQVGRFITPDPLLASGSNSNPQSWARYGYALNNPLTFTDPLGLYVCKNLSKKQCDQFDNALKSQQANLLNIGNLYGKDSKQYKNAERALAVYGKRDQDNGVFIIAEDGPGAGRAAVSGVSTQKTADNPTGQEILVKFDVDTFSDDAMSFGLGVIHEGSHAADGSDWVKSGFSNAKNPTDFRTEFDAHYIASVSAEALGGSRYDFPVYLEWGARKPYKKFRHDVLVWYKGWAEADKETLRKTNIEYLLEHHELYKLTPNNPQKAFFKGSRHR